VALRRVGERRFHIPRLPFRLGKEVAVHPRDEPWKIINGGAQDSSGDHTGGLINLTGKHPHHSYYDAEGRLIDRGALEREGELALMARLSPKGWTLNARLIAQDGQVEERVYRCGKVE